MMLEVENLSTHYGRIRALDGVRLEVAEGELVALVGANGAGKTTLLRTISGVHPPTGGRVRFRGADITAAPPERRVRLGIVQVPEGRQVFAPLAVADNLRLGAFTRPAAEAAASLGRIYAMFPQLSERRAQPAGTLSGGQQQMLAIGRALMGRPRLLLLDEPSMGLAPRLVAEIFACIAALKAEGITILLVDQNARAALRVADRGYVLETGRVALSGGAARLLDDPQVQEAYLGVY
ncbi:MAG: ABC transporter ATP-binding protein [Betaproteobacteria bacterium RIFCSPLOWO2_12_FULL_68_20]|nr:MAG: ABC transporter ATP-binding protein [Betaproteobacteria bacterium RIFCSPLOWO2_12_FULL_68_20]